MFTKKPLHWNYRAFTFPMKEKSNLTFTTKAFFWTRNFSQISFATKTLFWKLKPYLN